MVKLDSYYSTREPKLVMYSNNNIIKIFESYSFFIGYNENQYLNIQRTETF